MGPRLEILSNLAAGLGLILYGVVLMSRAGRPRLHDRLGSFTIALGVGLLFRGIHWLSRESWAAHVSLGAFGLFPLPLGLFFESLLRRHLHLVAKLVLLGGTVFFVGTCWTSLAVETRWWPLALIAYHSASVAYFGALTVRAYLASGTGPRRSLYGATLVVTIISVLFMGTDWAWLVGLSIPRLGAIPALAVLYFGGSQLDTAREWRLRMSLFRLGLFVGASAALAVLISLVEGRLSVASVLITGGVLLFALLAFEPFRHSLSHRKAQYAQSLFDRLAHVRARSLEELLATLRTWPEIEKALFLPAGELNLDSPREVVGFLEGNGSVASAHELDRSLAVVLPNEQLFVLEQVRFVMTSWQVSELGLVSPRGDLLGITFSVNLERTTCRRALELIVLLARLTSALGQERSAP
jgi:hypothetical protein